MNKFPLISVLLPVFNAEKYITESVLSILNQTYRNFELLVFDDCSTDSTLNLLSKITDKRLKIYNYTQKQGYVKLLNFGIEVSNGKYLARMDADDISLPNRFKSQLNVLESNDNIGLCGSYVLKFGACKSSIWRTPVKDSEIRCELLNGPPFCHPSVMLRKSVLICNNIKYNDKYYTAEDYFMWTELAKVTSFCNIPKVQLKYRIHKSQISQTNSTLQRQLKDSVRIKYLNDLLPTISYNQELLHINILNAIKLETTNDIESIDLWFNYLLKNLNRHTNVDHKDLENLFAKLLLNYLNINRFYSIKQFLIIRKSKLHYIKYWNTREIFGLIRRLKFIF